MWELSHRFSDLKVEIDVFKEGFELPDSVHDFRDLNTVNLSANEVGFKNPTLPIGEDVGSHAFSTVGNP